MPGQSTLSTRVTRSSSKKFIEDVGKSQGFRNAFSDSKKTKLATKLDFGSPSTKSPAVKKLKDEFSSSRQKNPNELASQLQKLLNLAAKHNSLQYIELPCHATSKDIDRKGNLRAAVPLNIEDVKDVQNHRPVISSVTPAIPVIKPSAPVISLKDYMAAIPKRKLKGNFKLQYAIVVDFESTCWEDKAVTSPHPEIIEFPAVLINLQTGKIEDHFQQYVMPTEMPKLSAFCTNLTGITQKAVDTGVPIGTCLRLFLSWAKSVIAERGMTQFTGHALTVDSTCPKFSFVTWTDWDMKVCLYQECLRKELIFPPMLKNWIDLKAAFRKNYGWTPQGLNGALTDLGLKFEGREHCGLDDAKNTSLLAYRMICDGAVFTQFSEM